MPIAGLPTTATCVPKLPEVGFFFREGRLADVYFLTLFIVFGYGGVLFLVLLGIATRCRLNHD
jgi:hypothetical protein